MDKKITINLVTWTLILSAFWLLLSGFFKPLLLSFGVVSVALVIFLMLRMNQVDKQPEHIRVSLRFLRYAAWLMKEIVVSSIEVSKLVWASPKKLEPVVAKLPIDTVPVRSRVLYANSITLSPGTLSIDLDEEHVTVHALEARSIEDLKTKHMARKVSYAAGVKDS